MRYIFKIILFSSLLFSSLLSNTNIDECKNDLYYANGIMLDMEISIEKHEETWKDKVDDMFLSNPAEYTKIANIKISYNASQGFFDDIFESAEQVMSNEWGWSEFSGYFRTYLELKGYQDSVDQHRPNLTAQVEAYKQSIKDGHGVIVVAHSQGNYYTNEAYEELDEWMKEYFHMFGVATPANHVAGYAVDDTTAPYVKFHNDFIKTVITGLDSNRDNPNLEHNSIVSIEAHDFYESYLIATNTKNDIFNFILNQIQVHSDAPSQWQTDQELNKGTENYKITVKHRFDSSVVMSEDVYPFTASKKLYHVDGNISGYVKASCGGTRILDADIDTWENKKDEEVYYLEGTGEIININTNKYIIKIRIYVNFDTHGSEIQTVGFRSGCEPVFPFPYLAVNTNYSVVANIFDLNHALIDSIYKGETVPSGYTYIESFCIQPSDFWENGLGKADRSYNYTYMPLSDTFKLNDDTNLVTPNTPFNSKVYTFTNRVGVHSYSLHSLSFSVPFDALNYVRTILREKKYI